MVLGAPIFKIQRSYTISTYSLGLATYHHPCGVIITPHWPTDIYWLLAFVSSVNKYSSSLSIVIPVECLLNSTSLDELQCHNLWRKNMFRDGCNANKSNSDTRTISIDERNNENRWNSCANPTIIRTAWTAYGMQSNLTLWCKMWSIMFQVVC